MEQIFAAFTAIVLGVGGMLAYYFGANFVVEKLNDRLKLILRPWIFVGPAVLVLFMYLVYPSLNTLWLSFMSRDGSEFVGLRNYEWAFSEPRMLEALGNNVLWLLVVPAFSTAFGLLIAILADRVKWESTAKAIIFMPMAISFVGASVIWRFIYYNDPNIGLLNAVVTGFGAEPVPWIITSPWNNFALMIILIWIQTGFAMVLLSAALKAVPEETLEAARIDGASEIRIFFNIIIPQITSTIAVVMTTIIILVLKVFDIPYVMTSGEFGTEVLANQMYRQLFRFGDFARGSTVAIVLMAAVVPVMIINIRRFQREEAMR